ncbi:MAG: outer membrane lipoprotein carrier protein LolA [Pseudomonadota bacterium]|nr:outer membrane lipoprotein carrier protein LolA [Pseudomonadota bacterium]
MFVASPLSRALVSAVAVTALAAPSLASPATDLRAVESHLAGTQSLVSQFTQTDGKGRQLTGTLSLKRPGRIRFEYGRGANMLLVANGTTLNFIDYDVGQKSSWPVAKSPLAVLLSANPDLGRIARIMPSNDPRVVVVRARDARRPEFGTLVLAFTRNPAGPAGLELEGWTAIDAQNKTTKVRLDGQRYNVPVAESAFTYAEPKRKR